MENGAGRWGESIFYENPEKVLTIFKVDMTGQDVSKGVYITGSFTGQNWKILKMYDAGNNIYEYITALSPGDSGAFYFLNDSNWTARETVPQSCAYMWNTDRKYIIGSKTTTISCKWSSCETSSVPSQVNVIFKVDMTGQDVSRGVYIVGEINNWKITKMASEGNNIYYWSTKLAPGSSLAYYYLTTNSWDNYTKYRETVLASCALKWNTDRVINVPPYDTVAMVLWGQCSWKNLAVFKVDMTGQDTSKGVFIGGSWIAAENQFYRMQSEGNNIFSYSAYFNPGHEGTYFFLNDSIISKSEKVPSECSDNNINARIYKIPDTKVTFAYKWGSCEKIDDNMVFYNNYNIDNIIISPNPAYDKIFISTQFPDNNTYNVQIIDFTGRIILNSLIFSNNFSFDISNLNPNIYLLKITSSKVNISKKFIVKKEIF